MKHLTDYINEHKIDESIDEGLIGDALRGAGSLLSNTFEKTFDLFIKTLGDFGNSLKKFIDTKISNMDKDLDLYRKQVKKKDSKADKIINGPKGNDIAEKYKKAINNGFKRFCELGVKLRLLKTEKDIASVYDDKIKDANMLSAIKNIVINDNTEDAGEFLKLGSILAIATNLTHPNDALKSQYNTWYDNWSKINSNTANKINSSYKPLEDLLQSVKS